jgi:hypothetical protein
MTPNNAFISLRISHFSHWSRRILFAKTLRHFLLIVVAVV